MVETITSERQSMLRFGAFSCHSVQIRHHPVAHAITECDHDFVKCLMSICASQAEIDWCFWILCRTL